MWNRIEFKNAGKANFRSKYWLFVAVSLLLSIAFGGTIIKEIFDDENASMFRQFISLNINIKDYIKPAATAVFGGASILSIAFHLLAANPYEVGASRFFAESRINENVQFSAVKAGFARRYGNIVLTRFLEDLYIALLCLLFVIPGIVRAFGYFAVPFILAENPDLDHSRVLKLSRAMTMGYKGKIFNVFLSFIGWYILSAITAEIVGIFYANPYINATKAEMYAFLRERALADGIATIDELPGFGEPSGYSTWRY